MEMSSPLAAMHPPPVPTPWGCKRDLSASGRLFGAHTFGPKNNFNFRDLSMGSRKKDMDYFALQPMRGSSPTASLAADMSSNLYVDQSPQFATPRRSLFTASLFQQPVHSRAEGTTTPPVRWEGVTTPPIPSSSPYCAPDSMDISPLPHKAPFSFVPERSLTLTLPSPTPDTTSAGASQDDMLSPCELPPPPHFSTSQLEVPRPSSAADSKRKSILGRPTMNRLKNYSTNTVSFKSQEQHPLPPFRFGSGVESPASVSSMSLDECFTASPPQERKMFSNALLAASKPKSFSIHPSVSRANGSPLAASIRKPIGPTARRPTKFRRSLSMYESPADVMNQKEDKEAYTPSTLQSVMDIDDAPILKLPHFTPENEPDSLPRITDSTFINILNGDVTHLYDEIVIVDCRFEYEYEGGHINGAINFCDKEQLAEKLFSTSETSANTLLIFHCEYSAHRAPLMAKFVRHEDRKVNAFRYPQLSYPEVYILDGGYSAFYEAHRTRCFPQNYLRMDAKEHESACERGMNKLRQRSKLNRAQTFAFGQSCQMEDSPTAAGRSNSGILTLGGDDGFSHGRVGTSRRMASY